jgi:PAS domain S-box-containing protein
MHYTGMASVSFTASPLVEDVSHAVDVSSLGVAGITIVSVFVVGIVAITSLLDRRFSAQAVQLASSEERYRLLFQRSLAAVYRSTPDGRILDCNETCARILGYESPRELMVLDANSASFEEGDRSEYLARLSADGLVSNLETSFKRKDGTRVWVLENANLVDDPTGGGSVVEGTFLDISDRKSMELELTPGAPSFAVFANGGDFDFSFSVLHSAERSNLARQAVGRAQVLFTILIKSVAAPGPQLRIRHQAALHRVHVHVVQLLRSLLPAPDVEIVEAALPETAMGGSRKVPPKTELLHGTCRRNSAP